MSDITSVETHAQRPLFLRTKDTTGHTNAASGITRLDKVQSFLDDKIADTPSRIGTMTSSATSRGGGHGRERAKAADADAVKDELLGAVQDDDDDDDLETDALKAENAR